MQRLQELQDTGSGIESIKALKTGVSAESGHLRCHNEEVVNMLVRLETQNPMQRAQDNALEK